MIFVFPPANNMHYGTLHCRICTLSERERRVSFIYLKDDGGCEPLYMKQLPSDILHRNMTSPERYGEEEVLDRCKLTEKSWRDQFGLMFKMFCVKHKCCRLILNVTEEKVRFSCLRFNRKRWFKSWPQHRNRCTLGTVQHRPREITVDRYELESVRLWHSLQKPWLKLK